MHSVNFDGLHMWNPNYQLSVIAYDQSNDYNCIWPIKYNVINIPFQMELKVYCWDQFLNFNEYNTSANFQESFLEACDSYS